MSNQDKNSFLNSERERFSNFVVDLRKVEKKVVSNFKKEKTKINWWSKANWGKFNQATTKINLNLLSFNKKEKNEIFKFNILASLQRLAVYFSYFKKLKLFKKNLVKSQKIASNKNHRREFILRQEKIFNSPVQLKKNKTAEDRRLDLAEEKVFWYRSIFSFSLVLILIIIPFKLLAYFQIFDFQNLEKQIKTRSEFAFSNLLAATDSVSNMNFKEADSRFQAAGANFLAAENSLSKINDSILSLAALSGNSNIKLAAESKKILQAGILSSSLGSNLAQATNSLFSNTGEDFPKRLDNFLLYGDLASKNAQDLQKTLSSINPDNLPIAYQNKFYELSKQTNLMVNNLVNFISLGGGLKETLGLSRDKRYLVVFQNNSELRASGGFIGSYALVDLKNGRINNLEVPGGGSYDTDGGMLVKVASPEPLWLVNPLWHFWDANWWPDWPTTAKNLMWFYSKSGGPSVDGVIGVTPTVLEGLLEITGPIDLTSEYGLTIDANNFWETVQKITERKNLAKTNPEAIVNIPTSSEIIKSELPLKQNLEINSNNKPKKIIGDLLVKVLEILPQKLSRDNLVKIISLFEGSMSEKQILLYFRDSYLQSEVSGQNWAGEIRPNDYDYLSIINTNIAGQKSDRLMTEKINLSSEVNVKGEIINTLQILRSHGGIKGEALTGVRNVDWLRIYVPAGSKLLSADGFRAPEAKFFKAKPEEEVESLDILNNERAAIIDAQTGTKIYQENNKTVFSNWLMVDPGEEAAITIKYRLPYNFFQNTGKDNWLSSFNRWLNPDFGRLLPYSLLVQKQPGAKPSEFRGSLTLPTTCQVFWHYPDSLTGINGWDLSEKLDSDKYWSVLVKDSSH